MKEKKTLDKLEREHFGFFFKYVFALKGLK